MEPLTSADPPDIGGYRLRARLGGGGMGRVYLAATPGGRPVALKVVRDQLAEDPEFRARFRQEIQAARKVHGLYTAQLLDADPDADRPWLVTAYVAGPSLTDAVAGYGPMPAPAVPLLIAGAAEALQVIHNAGLVHRDLTPSNVLLSPDGPRVIDFGIARAMDGIKATTSGVHVGSPQYMAPEQIRALPVTSALDVFALGSVAAFALLGRAPFGDDNAAAVMHRVLWEDPDLAGAPVQLGRLIANCLAKEPAERPGLRAIIERSLALAPSSDEPGLALGWPPSTSPAPGPGEPPPPMPSLPLPDTRSAVGPAVQPGWGWTSTTVVLPKQEVSQASNGSDARPRRAPRPQAATVAWLMYASAALAGLSVIVGVSTLPALRSMLASQHPAASGAALGSATRIAVVVLLARGLATGGLWLWAGWQARRDQGRDRMLAFAAFAVTTIGVVASYLQVLSTVPDRLIGVASWVAALGTVIVLSVAPAAARRSRHARPAG